MLFSLYQFLTARSGRILHHLLQKRLKKGKEDPARWQEKMGITNLKRPSGRLIWFHGASVGESLSILPLLDYVTQRHPEISIMVTTGTRTSASLMAQKLPKGAFHQFLPLDHPDWINRFLEHWQPDLALWVESELWPNILTQIKKRHIPAFLINARMSDRSYRKWRHIPQISDQILSCFTQILAQSKGDAERLEKLTNRPVTALHNLKYTAPKPLWQEENYTELLPYFDQSLNCLYASTHAGEEELAFKAHKIFRSKWPDFQTIIVPRHPERGTEIVKLAANLGLKAHQRSKKMPPSADGIYIADTLGELNDLFFLSPVTVMGGSLCEHGGHNPFEPAQIGRALLLGPHMFNFKEVTEMLHQADACHLLESTDHFCEALERLLRNPTRQQELSRNAEAFCASLGRSLPDYYQIISPFLKTEHSLQQPETSDENPKILAS